MLVAAIFFFIIAACFGVVIFKAILQDKPTPKPIVVIHGSIAVFSLLMVITAVAVGHTDTLLLVSLGLLILAALGGFTLFTIDMSKKRVPKLLASFHPLLALSGLITLIVYVAQKYSQAG